MGWTAFTLHFPTNIPFKWHSQNTAQASSLSPQHMICCECSLRPRLHLVLLCVLGTRITSGQLLYVSLFTPAIRVSLHMHLTCILETVSNFLALHADKHVHHFHLHRPEDKRVPWSRHLHRARRLLLQECELSVRDSWNVVWVTETLDCLSAFTPVLWAVRLWSNHPGRMLIAGVNRPKMLKPLWMM